jgi:hypothetical protein
VSHSACPDCQLRFTPGQAAGLLSCPICGGSFADLTSPRAVMGFQLFQPSIATQLLPEAFAASEPVPPHL